MKKLKKYDFIGDSIVYRSIAIYILLNCLFELVTGFVSGWEVYFYVI